MPANPAIHTSRRGARWVNTREGSNRAIDVYDSHDDASIAGRRLARREHVEHVNHRADGTIHEITCGS